MPEEPIPATVWLLSKLTTDLQSAKMWPVKLQGVKHQEALSKSMSAHADELEKSYFQLSGYLAQDPTMVDVTALNAANTLAQQRMTMFKEDNATASKVTKKPVTKGKGDGATQAAGDGTPARRVRGKSTV